MFCPICRGEFVEGVRTCNSCDVDLVDTLPADNREHTDIQWRRIATYQDPTRANLAAEFLESHDVDVLLGNEQTIGLNWFYSQLLGGVPLLVPVEQESNAREVLKSLGEAAMEDPPEFQGGHVDDLEIANTRRRNRAKLLVSFFLGGLGALLYRLLAGPDKTRNSSDRAGDA